MTDLKQLRQQIKDRLDQETTESLLSFIGYEIQRDHKFKLRPEEKTASASISRTGQITDFGSGWSGDPVALLHEHHGQSLKDATHYAATALGISYE
jgi:hypothetical protein